MKFQVNLTSSQALHNVRTGTDGAMDPFMSIGAAAYEALLPNDLPISVLSIANEFIRHTLEEYHQSGSYGTVMRHNKRLNQRTVPTIILGFPDIAVVPEICTPTPIAHIPVVVVKDRAALAGSIPTTWRKCINHKERVGIANVSIGGKETMQEAGSFGGWFSISDGTKLGLTCAHCLPDCAIGSRVASPSTTEITARLDSIIRYTELGPEPGPESLDRRLPRSKKREAEVASLRAQYTELPDDFGVELRDGTKIKLVGPDLGIIIAKQEHNVPILERHNERLRNRPGPRREFSLPEGISQSRLDWAVFRGFEHRVLGNLLTSEDLDDEPVARSGDLKPGASVIKIGRTTGHTEGVVNGVAIQIWESNILTQEVAVIASSGETSTGGFATTGDSGSLVVSLVDLEAVGLVVGKNDVETPRWVAVTPLWAVMEDIKRVIGEEVEFCGE